MTKSSTSRQPKLPEASRRAALDALDRVGAADDQLATVLRELRTQIRRFHRHIAGGGLASDPEFLERLASQRAEFARAMNDVEHARHTAQRRLFELAREDGMTVAAIARAWGISRQLVSRTLNERTRGDASH